MAPKALLALKVRKAPLAQPALILLCLALLARIL